MSRINLLTQVCWIITSLTRPISSANLNLNKRTTASINITLNPSPTSPTTILEQLKNQQIIPFNIAIRKELEN